MKARARIVAAPDGRGGTRLTVMHGESPLLPRRTGGPREGGGATVHLVGGAAGPLRGDELHLEIEVEPGADLEIRTVAAQLALPGRAHLPQSRMEITAHVGGSLRWLPEPLIAAAGCHHLAIADVTCSAGGSVLWRDDVVCGRHREPSGSVEMKTLLRYDGSTLYRHDLSIGPDAPGWSGAAVLGDARAFGTIVFAAGDPSLLPTPRSRREPCDVAVMPLAGPGALATAVGPDIRQVRAALDPLCAAAPLPHAAAV